MQSASRPNVDSSFGKVGVEEKQETSTTEPQQDAERDPLELAKQSTNSAEDDFISGLRLVLVISAVTLVAFLMLLDMSIIATVRCRPILPK